jgi:hypothetical protein
MGFEEEPGVPQLRPNRGGLSALEAPHQSHPRGFLRVRDIS